MASKSFTFIIGENKKPFVVHSGFLASISKPLDVLMNGLMAEAQSNTAVIDDVTEQEFAKIYEYACSEDYSSPQLPEPAKKDCRQPDECTLDHEHSEWDGRWVHQCARARFDKGPHTARRSLWSDFAAYYDGWNDNVNGRRFQQFSPKADPGEFMTLSRTHARIYALADKYAMHDLMELSLRKLHQNLVRCPVEQKTTGGDIFALVRYAYESTPASSNPDAWTLRRMLVDFIACEIDILGNNPGFLILFSDGGDFQRDLWKVLQDNLHK